jgi:CHAD domain-containing protein
MQDSIGYLVRDFSLGATNVMSHEGSVEIFHEFRISGKPLRYVMELAEPCFYNGFNDYFRKVKKIIGLLGDIHDLDIAHGALGSFCKELQSYNDLTKAAIDHFPVEFLLTAKSGLEVERKNLLEKTLIILHKWKDDRFFKKFLALVNRPM